MAAITDLSHELDKEAMRSLVHAENSVFLTDMNLALSNQCKQFRVENAPSAPDAEEARLPLGVGRGQLINMMLERTNQRLKQATAPEARMFNS